MLLFGLIAIIIGLCFVVLSPWAARTETLEEDRRQNSLDRWRRFVNPKLGLAMVAIGVLLTMLPYLSVWWNP